MNAKKNLFVRLTIEEISNSLDNNKLFNKFNLGKIKATWFRSV